MKNLLFCVLAGCLALSAAEPPFERGAVLVRNEIRVAASGIRAIALAAHPDDEDGATLAYLRGLGVETHTCFCTRGEGGQNEAGPELGVELAAIRTREIEAACAILGAKAWFLNCPDFGYSKSVEETLQVWNHDAALGRLVHVIREIRPHIVITNHDPDGTDHGHHRTAGKLLAEAFDAAADPSKYPEQLGAGKLAVWQISTIFLHRFAPAQGKFSVDVSVRDELSGMSASEIGALALAKHVSQGMQRELKTGERELRYFSILKTKAANPPGSLLDGLLPDERSEREAEAFRPVLAKNLVDILSLVDLLTLEHLSTHAGKHLRLALAEELGIKLEAACADAFIAPGEKTQLLLRIANMGALPVVLEKISFESEAPEWHSEAIQPDQELKPNSVLSRDIEVQAPAGAPFSYPPNDFLFTHESRAAPLRVRAEFLLLSGFFANGNVSFEVRTEVPLLLAPPVSFAPLPPSLLLFAEPGAADDTDEVVPLKLSGTANAKLSAPLFIAAKAGPKPKQGEDGLVLPLASKNSTAIWNLRQLISVEQLARGPVEIPLHAWDSEKFYSVPSVTVQRVTLEMPVNMRVALVKGVDDQTYHALKSMQDAGVGRGTFSVTMLSDEDLRAADLNRFQTVVLDIRATQQRPVVREIKERLRAFMDNGGTVLCFYQKDFDWNEHGKGLSERGTGFFKGTGGGGALAPFPIEVSFERVTREDAPMRILNPEHLLLSKPCHITARDFDGWVQERGAYFPKKWAPEYTALLSCGDPGEAPLDGGLLVADVGRGAFIYTSYFLHRQLRANVPGAYRLLANMLSYSRMKR